VNKIDKDILVRNEATKRFSEFVEKNRYDVEWDTIATACGVSGVPDAP
jgi:hypothetical protein